MLWAASPPTGPKSIFWDLTCRNEIKVCCTEGSDDDEQPAQTPPVSKLFEDHEEYIVRKGLWNHPLQSVGLAKGIPRTIVLIGGPGSGKRLLGNYLLGRVAFPQGQNLPMAVAEGPWFGALGSLQVVRLASLDLDAVKTDGPWISMLNGLSEVGPIHSVILTVSTPDFTDLEAKILSGLRTFFGAAFWRHFCLFCTGPGCRPEEASLPDLEADLRTKFLKIEGQASNDINAVWDLQSAHVLGADLVPELMAPELRAKEFRLKRALQDLDLVEMLDLDAKLPPDIHSIEELDNAQMQKLAFTPAQEAWILGSYYRYGLSRLLLLRSVLESMPAFFVFKPGEWKDCDIEKALEESAEFATVVTRNWGVGRQAEWRSEDPSSEETLDEKIPPPPPYPLPEELVQYANEYRQSDQGIRIRGRKVKQERYLHIRSDSRDRERERSRDVSEEMGVEVFSINDLTDLPSAREAPKSPPPQPPPASAAESRDTVEQEADPEEEGEVEARASMASKASMSSSMSMSDGPLPSPDALEATTAREDSKSSPRTLPAPKTAAKAEGKAAAPSVPEPALDSVRQFMGSPDALSSHKPKDKAAAADSRAASNEKSLAREQTAPAKVDGLKSAESMRAKLAEAEDVFVRGPWVEEVAKRSQMPTREEILSEAIQRAEVSYTKNGKMFYLL